MEDAGASLLLGQSGVVLLGEMVEERIAAVGDKGGEVGAVRQFEGQDRRGMVGAQALQLGHRPTLLNSESAAIERARSWPRITINSHPPLPAQGEPRSPAVRRS